MFFEYGSSFRPNGRFSIDDCERISGLINSVRDKEYKRIRSYCDRATRIDADYTKQFVDLIGKDRLPHYLKLHARRMKSTRSGFRKSALSAEEIVQLNQRRIKNVEKSKQLIKRSGLTLREIDALRKKYRRLEVRAFSRIVEKEDAASELAAPKPRSPRTIRLTAPFDYAGDDVYSEKSDEASEPFGNAYANLQDGLLIGESHIKVDGADNSDHSLVRTYASLGKGFTVARTGRLAVWADLTALCCSRFDGSIRRECFSITDVEVFEDVQVRICVFNVSKNRYECKWTRLSSPEKGVRSFFRLTYPENEPDGVGSWNIDWWDINEEVRTTCYYYDLDFEEGDLAFVSATLVTTNRFWSNDFTVDSNLKHLYRLREIGVF